MDRSSTLTEEPIVNDIDHADTVCTVGWTNFSVRINPAGMALLKNIDPTAVFIERYAHMYSVNAVVHRARSSGGLHTVNGFAAVYEQVLRENDTSSTVTTMAVHGFPYDVDVEIDSPLVGWFTVMKGVSNG
jgi:hypothetical protein